MQDLTDEMDLEIPEALVQAEMESMVHNIQHSLEQQGIDLANFLRITGQDEQSFVEDLKVRATQSLKTRILLEAVVADAELTVDDDEMSQAIVSIAAQSDASEDEVLRQALRALEWRDDEAAAIQEGIDDMQAGRVKPLREFDRQFREQKNIPQDA